MVGRRARTHDPSLGSRSHLLTNINLKSPYFDNGFEIFKTKDRLVQYSMNNMSAMYSFFKTESSTERNIHRFKKKTYKNTCRVVFPFILLSLTNF